MRPGVFSGLITARSSDDPGRDHTYTVWIDELGTDFEGVSPQPETRWTRFDDTLEVNPFPIGTRVTVHLFRVTDGLEAMISDSELPVAGECQ